MHQSYDFGHNKGRSDASAEAFPEIFVDIFDVESESADVKPEEADDITEDETSTVFMETDDFTADVNTTGVLAADGTASSGTLEVEGDEDWFAIEVVANEVYSLNVSNLDMGPDLVFSVYDDEGGLIVAADPFDPFFDGTFAFEATETATFFVGVEALEFGQFLTGDYEIAAAVIDDDFSASVNTTGVLATDGTVTTGMIDFDGDADWLAIDVVAGEFYTIVLDSDTFFPFELLLNLRDSFGDVIASGIDLNGTNLTLMFTATETDTYYVDVAGDEFAFDTTGNYELVVIQDDFSADVNTTGVLATDGTVTTGMIDLVGDADWFAIDVVAGEQYTVDLTGISISIFDVDLSLYSSSGNFISGQSFADQLIFTAAETGTVFIEAAVPVFIDG